MLLSEKYLIPTDALRSVGVSLFRSIKTTLPESSLVQRELSHFSVVLNGEITGTKALAEKARGRLGRSNNSL